MSYKVGTSLAIAQRLLILAVTIHLFILVSHQEEVGVETDEEHKVTIPNV